jgi:hypothetical protein
MTTMASAAEIERTAVLRYLDQPKFLLGYAVAVVVGLLGHNLAQAYLARALGDQTAVRAGFGQINARQLDVLGVVAALLTVSCWGFTAPVPVDLRSRRRRPRAVIALLAGPLFLFAMTVLFVALYAHARSTFLVEFSLAGAGSSAGLFVTSCASIPPFALGRALWIYAPTTAGWSSWRYRLEEENIGRLIVFAILMLPLLLGGLPDVVGELVNPLLTHLIHAFA